MINENDTTTTDEISFGDNDFLAAQVAILIGADRLVLLTDTDGLYTRRPALAIPARSWCDVVASVEELEGFEIGVSSSPLGSGGMRSKVVAAEMATAAGIPAGIASGVRARGGGRARWPASRPARASSRRSGRVSSFKLWLKYAKPTHGRLVVDDGRRARAARARHQPAAGGRGRGRGRVRGGRRGRGALANGRRPIGKGIVNYSAEELRRVKGMKTDEVRELLPRATEEAVHRDYFVLE